MRQGGGKRAYRIPTSSIPSSISASENMEKPEQRRFLTDDIDDRIESPDVQEDLKLRKSSALSFFTKNSCLCLSSRQKPAPWSKSSVSSLWREECRVVVKCSVEI